MKIEDTIISTLLTNPIYFSKVFSHLKDEHFSSIENQEVFKLIKKYYSEYQEHPKPKEVGLSLKEISSEKLRSSCIAHFKLIMTDERISNLDFMVDKTQEFVQKQEFTKAILEGAEAVQKGKDLAPTYASIGDALKINFDADVGLNYSDLDRRLQYYKRKIQGLEVGMKEFDKIIGGYRKKTLNIIGSVSHGGKSALLSHVASSLLLKGNNILFITLEMSEEEICKRIDANILNIDINTFKSTPDSVFHKAYDSVKDALGTLVVKEYPAGSFDVLRLESLMSELYNEEEFKPDIICIDYLTLMKSSRASPSVGSYQYYKLISEELHGFAKKYDIPIISPTQLNRGAYGNKDAGLESVSDSLGIAQTADTFISVVRSKEMDELGQVLVTIQKNRNTGNLSSFRLGIDYSHMRYFDIEGGEDTTLAPVTQEMMSNPFGDLELGF